MYTVEVTSIMHGHTICIPHDYTVLWKWPTSWSCYLYSPWLYVLYCWSDLHHAWSFYLYYPWLYCTVEVTYIMVILFVFPMIILRKWPPSWSYYLYSPWLYCESDLHHGHTICISHDYTVLWKWPPSWSYYLYSPWLYSGSDLHPGHAICIPHNYTVEVTSIMFILFVFHMIILWKLPPSWSYYFYSPWLYCGSDLHHGHTIFIPHDYTVE